MKKSTTMSQVLFALMCLFGLTASAQFSATLNQGPTSDYSNVGHQFKLTEVAEALGTDTATLAAQLSDVKNTKVFAVIDSTGTVDTYTGNPGEFWLTLTGQVHEFSGATWFVGENYDVENDVFNVYVGQMPNYFTASDTLHVKAALVYGGKTVTFDMTYQVYVPKAPEAELAISKLNIVGEASTSIEQYPRSAYDMDKVYVKVSDLAEKLGADKDDLSYMISKIAYLPRVDATYGIMSDSLTIASTNDGWMKRTIDSKGDSTWNCGNSAYNNSDVLYVNSFSYNTANDTLTCQIGQYPGANKVGDKPNFDVYLVYGSKAYKVNYTINIIEAPYQGLEDMTLTRQPSQPLSAPPPATCRCRRSTPAEASRLNTQPTTAVTGSHRPASSATGALEPSSLWNPRPPTTSPTSTWVSIPTQHSPSTPHAPHSTSPATASTTASTSSWPSRRAARPSKTSL